MGISSRHMFDISWLVVLIVIIMSNQELIDLVGLLLFRTQEDQNKAINTLYINPVRSIESLTALLKVKTVPSISSEQLDAAKLSASTCLNYMLKVGVKEVDGVEQLGTFWDVLFDWRIDMVHKLNLEDTFQYLYRFWYAKHEKIFEQGMAKVTRALNKSSNNDCQLRTSVKLAAQNCEFFLSMDGHYSISNVIESLLLIGRSCMSALTCEKVYYEGFTTLMEIMAALFKAIKKWKTEARVELAKLQTINWMIDCLEEAGLGERNRRAMIEEVYKRGKMSDMIMDTYKKGGILHQGAEKGICWLCLGGNLQQRNSLMREKEAIAKIHLRFVRNCNYFYERIHTFLEKEEEFQLSIISSLYCFASSKCTDRTIDSFASSLLELCTTHFKHYPQFFSNCFQITFSNILLPLMDLEHSKQEELESDPLYLLDLLDNLQSGNTLDISIVKAAAFLRQIVLKYQNFYEKLVQNIIKIFESQEFDEQFWETKRPSLDCCLLILISLSQNLKYDQLSLQKLLQAFSKGIQIMLSNLSLCLVAFLFRVITRDTDIPLVRERFLDFAKEGLQRNKHTRQFMMELYIEDQGEQFSLPFLQSAFKELFLHREDDTDIVYYQEIIEGSIKYHNKQLSNQDLVQLLSCSIDFCHTKISKKSCKNNKNSVLFTLRLIICAYDVCHPKLTSQINAQIANFLVFLQRQEYLQFQEQILQLTLAFFRSLMTFTSEHLLLAQKCVKSYKESGYQQLYLVIFSRIITISCDLSISIVLIFGQLNETIKQMNKIEQKEQKKLYQQLLVIEHCIQSKGQSLGLDQVSSLISRLLFLLEKFPSPIIRCRTANIMLAARTFLKLESSNWPFMIKVVESLRIPHDQLFLAVKKIELFVENLSSNKKVEEYVNILRFLDRILRVTNRKAKTIEPICDCSHFLHFQRQEEAIERKAKKITLSILQKKRLTFFLIEKGLNNDEISFLRGIQLLPEEESTEEGVKAISFLCS